MKELLQHLTPIAVRFAKSFGVTFLYMSAAVGVIAILFFVPLFAGTLGAWFSDSLLVGECVMWAGIFFEAVFVGALLNYGAID